VALVCFGLGALNASVRSVERLPAASLAESVPACRVLGRTLEEPGGLGVLAALDRADCGDRGVVTDAGAVFLDDVAVGPGRRFVAEGWLVPLGDELFDVARRRAGAAAAFAARGASDLGPATRAHALSTHVRDRLAEAVAHLGRPGQLLRGLTIGDTGGIDPHTEEDLRRSGLAHLLAVSGSNVAILLGTIALVLRRASFATRVAACALALVAFVAVVGPDASVLRAAGMGVVALTALVYGRRTEPLHALGLALAAVVALRPGIVYSTGLHLSAAATAGIVLWTRPITRRLGRLPKHASVAVAATIAAQAAVAPLLVGVFGQLPVAGVVANVLALPAVAPATVLGLAAAAAGAVADAPALLLASAAAPFAGWILGVGERLGEPAWASPAVSPRWGIFLAAPVLIAAIAAVPGALRPHARNLDADAPDPHPEGR
jgi:competence protein ComEC